MARDAGRRVTYPTNNRTTSKSTHYIDHGRRHTTFDEPAESHTNQDGKTVYAIHKSKRSKQSRRSPLKDITQSVNIQDQIEGYEQNLEKELTSKFSVVSIQTTQQLAELTESFDNKCAILENVSETIGTPLQKEQIDIGQGETVELGQVFTLLKECYTAKRGELHRYWTEYVEIQTQIMQLAYMIATDDQIELSRPDVAVDESEHDVEWHIDEHAAEARKEKYQEMYNLGIAECERMLNQVYETRDELINEAADAHTDSVRKTRSFKDGLRKALLELELDSESDGE